ncbi:SO_0444 family Cu/Zn efflux transporter [Vibrio gallicus]|uniref:SO_0444 family Cu/Zn efflux transporter n=1 Tax=Vibrio gallicus TaxID=190897 RepID=UPI0021C2F9CD|nr:SO_0444 family Cu/Zn efflux transporter [Vibrio gallicus]
MNLVQHFIELFIESGFWMLLGLVVAGLLKEWVPTELLSKHLGGKGAKTTIKAAFIGAPLPLCSCGVIPAALGLRRSGASKSATTSFLVATPETGLDSVSVSYALLGPFMAVMRPIAAICSAIVAGLLVGKDANRAEPKLDIAGLRPLTTPQPSSVVLTTIKPQPVESNTSSCCSTQKATCCSSKLAPTKKGAVQKLKAGIGFAATDLVKDISTWLIIGLFFAALVQTYVEADFLAQWGGSIWSMLLMVVVSVPMYICATASTPIAAGLLMSGISPGAVLVFMLAGPATNVATLGVVWKELGKRSLIAYLTGVIGTALVFGFMTDYLVSVHGFVVQPLSAAEHEVVPHWLSISSAIVLAALMVNYYVRVAISKWSASPKCGSCS